MMKDKRLSLNSARLLLAISGADPVQAIESAKRMVRSRRDSISASLLIDIAAKTCYRPWSRIAAVYALGLLNHEPSVRILVRILQDPSESIELRAHAAEALGNLGRERALPALRKILMSDQKLILRKWCIYAISEIGGTTARRILGRFAKTHPRGTLLDELNSVMSQ
ncbi:MAG TPA: HEAT repeat domain-containing protein [Candidatus Dormibacteraeota bacterium]|jgi:hypothetical protein|nr:HEAT repeat domain-containing protein [Candidatus Dormibacteraeota bacterium]